MIQAIREQTMEKSLYAMLEAAKKHPPTAAEREQQRRSFAYGNTHFENKLITREMINQEADKINCERANERK